MAKSLTPEQQQLLDSIETLLADGENLVTLPLTAINQGIAQLSGMSGKTVAQIQSKLLKSIDQFAVDNDNAIDGFGLTLLKPLQDWQDENNLLLTQLAASAGLTQPGDPLEAALTQEIASVPELAYSATLLMAIRDFLPSFGALIEVLREIRDRMPGAAAETPGEIPAKSPSIKEPAGTVSVSWQDGPAGPWESGVKK